MGGPARRPAGRRRPAVLRIPEERRRWLRPAVRRYERLVGAEPIGARALDQERRSRGLAAQVATRGGDSAGPGDPASQR